MTPRGVALGLGVSYAALTVLELLLGEWSVGEAEVLHRTTKVNLLHWTAALAMLGSFFAGAGASRGVLRIAGIAFLGLAIWGITSTGSLGTAFGFDGSVPWTYTAYHAVTAILALSGGFLPARTTV